MPTPTHDKMAAAPLDALLIARSFWRDDEEATQVLLKHCDPYSTALQLAGWLRAAVRYALDCGGGQEFDDRDEFDVIKRWIALVRKEGEQ